MPNEAMPSLPESTEELLSLAEQLSERIVQLERANSQLQAQLASVLAAEHTPLLHYGHGTWQRTLNARSIKVLFLAEQTVRNTIPPQREWRVINSHLPRGRWQRCRLSGCHALIGSGVP